MSVIDSAIRPVYALFQLETKKVNEGKRQKLLLQIYAELDLEAKSQLEEDKSIKSSIINKEQVRGLQIYSS